MFTITNALSLRFQTKISQIITKNFNYFGKIKIFPINYFLKITVTASENLHHCNFNKTLCYIREVLQYFDRKNIYIMDSKNYEISIEGVRMQNTNKYINSQSSAVSKVEIILNVIRFQIYSLCPRKESTYLFFISAWRGNPQFIRSLFLDVFSSFTYNFITPGFI